MSRLEVVRSDVQPTWGQRVEARLTRLSERLNPILVKEARQALKSRQFLITFSLLLIAGWAWSLLGVAMLSPGVYYAPGGQFMLSGYYLVLVLPLLVVVPFSAFRSLAGEREDGTFELLTITTLQARQIITGKLGSAILQMIVYYSALAPCIVFTYLLRGVDIVAILFVLIYTFVISLMLSAAGLVIATLGNSRHWQVALSVLLLVALLIAGIIWTFATLSIIAAGQSVPYNSLDFWTTNAAVTSFAIAFLVLFILTAASQISFASDNRSTRLRYMLFVIQLVWIGWISYFWIKEEQQEFMFMFVIVPCFFWYLMGALLVGEYALLSPRVKRSLPQSFLGRTLLTWFNPGSGTGYAFAVSNLAGLILLAYGMALLSNDVGFNGQPNAEWFLFALVCGCYTALFLGVGRLLVLFTRQFGGVGPALSLLIHLLLAMLAVAIPLFIQARLQGYSDLEYTSWQITNWAWTAFTAGKGTLFGHPVVPIVVFAATVVIGGLNLLLAIAEVEQVRQEAPQRVLEEENLVGGATPEVPNLGGISMAGLRHRS